jgi:TP901 family phage tail tape measure protein
MGANAATLNIQIQVDGKGGIKVLRQVGDAAEQSGKKGQKSFNGMGKSAKSATALILQLGAAAGGLYALKRGYDAVESASRGFGTALTDMARVTDRDLGKMREEIMKMSPALGDATSLMQGYYQTISAGVRDPAKAMEFLTEASRAAKSAHVEQELVVKALSKVMAGYAGEIETATEASDLLFTIEKMGQTTFAELVPVIGEVSAISKQVGVNSNEMGAALASVTQTAGSTSQAATQYKAILMGLYKPQEQMSKALTAMGFESGKAAVEQLGLAGTLKAVDEYARKGGIGLGKLFESSEALVGLGPLLQTQFRGYNENLAEMEKKTGATDQAFKNWSKTAEATGEIFRNTINKKLIELGEKIMPDVQKGMIGFSDWITENDESIMSFFTSLVTAIGGIGAAGGWIFEKTAWIPQWAGDLGAAFGLASAGMIEFSQIAAASSPEALKKLVDQFDESKPNALATQLSLVKDEIKELEATSKRWIGGIEGGVVIFNTEELAKARAKLADINSQIAIQEVVTRAAAGEFDGLKDGWMSYAQGAVIAAEHVDQATKNSTATRLAAEKKFQEDRAALASRAVLHEKEAAEENLVEWIKRNNAEIKIEKDALKKIAEDKETARKKETDGLKKLAADAEKLAADRAGAYRTMYGDLKGQARDYYKYQEKLLAAERDEYIRLTGDQETAQRWFTSRHKDLQQEQTLASNDFFGGVRVGFDQTQDDMITWAETGRDLFTTFASSSKNALSDGLFDLVKGDLQDLSTYWDSIWDSMLRKVTDNIAGMAVDWAMGGVSKWASAGGLEDAWSWVEGVFDTGAWEVKKDQLGMLHKGEIVIPPELSSKIRAGGNAYAQNAPTSAVARSWSGRDEDILTAGLNSAAARYSGYATTGASLVAKGQISFRDLAKGLMGPNILGRTMLSGVSGMVQDAMGMTSTGADIGSTVLGIIGSMIGGPIGGLIGGILGSIGGQVGADAFNTRDYEVARDEIESFLMADKVSIFGKMGAWFDAQKNWRSIIDNEAMTLADLAELKAIAAKASTGTQTSDRGGGYGLGVGGIGQSAGYKALGGDVYRGDPYWVGEKGIELFVPDRNGTIVPNSHIRPVSEATGGGGGTPIQMHLTVEIGGTEFYADVRTIARHEADEVRVVAARRDMGTRRIYG